MDPRLPGHPADRRIDDRVPVDGLAMGWGLSRRGWSDGAAESTARVINVSRGGLLALVPKSRDLRDGVEVPIEIAGGHGRVRVTYVRPSARRGWRLCGLGLIDGDVLLLALIEEIITDASGIYAQLGSTTA